MSAPLSLLEVLAQVPDPRNPKGIRHPLPAILSLVVLAMLTGAKSYTAVAQFGRDKGFALAIALGFRRGKTPAKSTLSVLFRALDITAFEAALSRWVASRLPEDADKHVALDGKTARGSKDGEVPGQHLVAAYMPSVQAVLAQIRVDAKTNEHKAALELLGILPLAGWIFSGDAIFCQHDVCQKVVDGGGDYVWTVKDNQPSLAVDIACGLAFEEQQRRQAAAFPPYQEVPPPEGSVARSVSKGHGRLEVRTLRVTTTLTKKQEWAGLKQGFELTRERTEKGKKTVEVVYGITSLSRDRADAERLLELTREHWGIENGSHYRRDVTLGEDQSRIRKGTAPQVMAGLRNAVIHIAQEVAPALATAIRRLGNCFSQALSLLGLPQLE
jgi:predicted transposase YbfD/YdcC